MAARSKAIIGSKHPVNAQLLNTSWSLITSSLKLFLQYVSVKFGNNFKIKAFFLEDSIISPYIN